MISELDSMKTLKRLAISAITSLHINEKHSHILHFKIYPLMVELISKVIQHIKLKVRKNFRCTSNRHEYDYDMKCLERHFIVRDCIY